jgi:hypothetical protein
MHRYLIETPHKEHDCLDLLQLIHAAGYLTHFDWGCMNGVHSGWAIVEAEDAAHAQLMVPPLVRAEARVVQLNKFDHAMLAALHQD